MKNKQEKETDYIQKKLSEDDSENDSDYDSYGLLDVEDGNGKKEKLIYVALRYTKYLQVNKPLTGCNTGVNLVISQGLVYISSNDGML